MPLCMAGTEVLVALQRQLRRATEKCDNAAASSWQHHCSRMHAVDMPHLEVGACQESKVLLMFGPNRVAAGVCSVVHALSSR